MKCSRLHQLGAGGSRTSGEIHGYGFTLVTLILVDLFGLARKENLIAPLQLELNVKCLKT